MPEDFKTKGEKAKQNKSSSRGPHFFCHRRELKVLTPWPRTAAAGRNDNNNNICVLAKKSLGEKFRVFQHGTSLAS